MLVRTDIPPPCYHFDRGYGAGLNRGRFEAETALSVHADAQLDRGVSIGEANGYHRGLHHGFDEAAILARASADESFRLGFAEGARLGYVNGYMQGSGDCAAAVVAHENGTPEAAPVPFANFRSHLELLSSVGAGAPAVGGRPERALLTDRPLDRAARSAIAADHAYATAASSTRRAAGSGASLAARTGAIDRPFSSVHRDGLDPFSAERHERHERHERPLAERPDRPFSATDRATLERAERVDRLDVLTRERADLSTPPHSVLGRDASRNPLRDYAPLTLGPPTLRRSALGSSFLTSARR